jgi:hypothetical protein
VAKYGLAPDRVRTTAQAGAVHPESASQESARPPVPGGRPVTHDLLPVMPSVGVLARTSANNPAAMSSGGPNGSATTTRNRDGPDE